MKKQVLKLALLSLMLCNLAYAQNSQPGAAPVAVTNAVGNEKVELKLHWKVGKRYLVKMVSAQKISQTVEDKPINVEQTFGLSYLYDVQDVDAQGAARVEIAFRDVQFKLVVPGEKTPFVMEYDSTKTKEVPPIVSGIASLVGQKVWMRIAPSGRVIEGGGFKELLEHMMKSISIPPGAERTMMETMMKGQFSEESFKETLQKGNSVTYPDHPVAIGDSWTSAMTLTQALPMQLDSLYNLKERKNGLSLIEMESNLALDSKGKPVQTANSKTSMMLKGRQSGTIQIRESDGWIVKSQSTLDFSGTVSVSTTPSGPGDMRRASNKSWPMSITGTTTVESEDL